MPKYYRKVIRIRAVDSPNVRYALAQQARGEVPTGEVLVPGVLSWDRYQKHLATWDEVQRCVKLGAMFYQGAQLLLFPPAWLDRANAMHQRVRGRVRKALAIGIDPAEGGDKTSMAAVDEYGLVELVSRKTPDTSVIQGEAIAFAARHGVPPERVCVDRGGGGKQLCDSVARDTGMEFRTVAFGETLTLDPKRGLRQVEERLDNKEEKYAYVNRRAQMYWELSLAMDPRGDVRESQVQTFAVPNEREGEVYAELRRQLAVMDKLYDREGRCRMRPKNRVGTQAGAGEKTLVEIIGHSPDEADAVVLALFGRDHEKRQVEAGGF